MNKKISFLILSGIMLLPAVSSAQLTYGMDGDYSISSIITGIMDNTWIIFAAVAVICFIVAGATFLTAEGSPEKIKTARAAFFWGLAGVAVGIISYSIITLVGSII